MVDIISFCINSIVRYIMMDQTVPVRRDHKFNVLLIQKIGFANDIN